MSISGGADADSPVSDMNEPAARGSFSLFDLKRLEFFNVARLTTDRCCMRCTTTLRNLPILVLSEDILRILMAERKLILFETHFC